jgi:hypothetical protein
MFKKLFVASIMILTSLVLTTSMVSAAVTDTAPNEPIYTAPDKSGITNPVIGTFGDNPANARSGSTFVRIFILIWQLAIMIGALVVIVMFIWASLEWILAGGDAGKIQKARDRMMQGVVGLIILASSFVIIGFINTVIFGGEFDILKLTLPTP